MTRGLASKRWQRELQEAVNELLEQRDPSPERIAACIEHASAADVGANDDVNFALHELFRIVEGVS